MASHLTSSQLVFGEPRGSLMARPSPRRMP
jgi:hypothetical protein